MTTETFQYLALFVIVMIAIVGFAAVSIWAWRDNILLFRRLVDRASYYAQRIRRRWRMLWNSEYRQYEKLIERYEGSVLLLHSLQLKEEVFDRLVRIVDTDKERKRFTCQRDAFHDARVKCMPRVAQELAGFDVDQLIIIAQHLAGFNYDSRLTGADSGKVAPYLNMLIRQRDAARDKPHDILNIIGWLEELCEED